MPTKSKLRKDKVPGRLGPNSINVLLIRMRIS